VRGCLAAVVYHPGCLHSVLPWWAVELQAQVAMHLVVWMVALGVLLLEESPEGPLLEESLPEEPPLAVPSLPVGALPPEVVAGNK